jgi:hypothetical protein
VIDAQAGRRRQAEFPRRLDAPVPSQDPVLAIDQHRVGEPEAPDALCDLSDLLARMGSNVARPGPQLVDGKSFEGVGGQGDLLSNSYSLPLA